MLGPVEVWDGHAWMPVRAAKVRTLLAILVLNRGQVLDRDWLIDALWQGNPPPSAAQLLPHYLWRLRTLLPDGANQVRTVPLGYLCALDPGNLDHERFAALLEDGRTAAAAGQLDPAIATLDSALALWRGPALADARSGDLLDAAARRLDQLRVEAEEIRAETRMASGRHVEALPALTELTAIEPFRERGWHLLILALYRAGRRPAALAAYQRLWHVWTDQLGIEPGHGLRELHRRVLADDPALLGEGSPGQPATGLAPRQLPIGVRHFVGRTAELKELTGLLDEAASAVVISAIDGTAGIGKTALALHWAHQVAARYPDGQLYVNLRGFDPSGAPMQPAEAIRGFLDAFAVPADRIPLTLQAQAGLYRTLVAGRRVLVMLDNARDVEQVRPLLPGSGSCLVVVTSRSRLAGLVAAEDAYPITLDLLTAGEADDLLARRLGPARTAGEPAAVREIIARCARLPLALAIVAARAVTQPAVPLAQLATELREARSSLDALATDDAATDIRAVFSWSYRRLSAPAARLFRLLALHPGPHIARSAAASLAGVPIEGVRPLLAELADLHLVAEWVPGRYTFHDLLRSYATELVDTDDPVADRRAAIHRMLDHYLHTAYAAARLINPHRDPITLAAPAASVTVDDLADAESAMAWFTTEHQVLVAVVDAAGNTGFDSYPWQLAWSLTTFFQRRGHARDAVTTQRAGLAAALRLGDLAAQTHAHRGLARALEQAGNYAAAKDHHERTLSLCRQLRDDLGAAHTHFAFASIFDRQGDYREALSHTRAALDLFRAAGHETGTARALNGVGWFLALLGDYPQAIALCQQALDICTASGNRGTAAAAWDSIGYAHHRGGDLDRAIDCYRRSIELYHAVDEAFQEAGILNHLGDAHRDAGDLAAARDAWRRAVDLFDRFGHGDAAGVRAKLGASINSR
jgi:DNA-binding SARP family transcriptional activator/Tfp pilus assembly protein PilF